MATGYEPNIQGAISVLRDLMVANSVNMTREPYDPNYRGLVDAVIDLKEGFTTCLLYTSPSPRDRTRSRMPSSA